MQLEDLGWDAFFADAFEPYAADNLIPARVSARHHGPCELLTENGRMGGLPAGKLSDEELPAVGDWVAVRPVEGERKAIIEAVLPRRTSFSRKEAFQRTREQVVAANVDTVFIVTAFGFDLNPRRLERYLTAAWDSGSTPVIVVNKLDTADDPWAELAFVEPVAMGVPIHSVSAVTGEGLDELDAYLRVGATIVLLGSSGVGKSTLINRFAGSELLETSATSAGWARAAHDVPSRARAASFRGALARHPGDARAAALGRRGSARHDVLGDRPVLGGVQVLRLLAHERAGLRDSAGARGRHALAGSLVELHEAPARDPGARDPQGRTASLRGAQEVGEVLEEPAEDGLLSRARRTG